MDQKLTLLSSTCVTIIDLYPQCTENYRRMRGGKRKSEKNDMRWSVNGLAHKSRIKLLRNIVTGESSPNNN